MAAKVGNSIRPKCDEKPHVFPVAAQLRALACAELALASGNAEQAIAAIRALTAEYSEPVAVTADTQLAEVLTDTRAVNVLEAAGIVTVGDVWRRTDAQLLAVKSFGPKAVEYVRTLTEQKTR